jgi:RimJ/RimL family protein N-acetyltransferase
MPSIETDRLLLRMIRADDLDHLAALLSDPDVVKYVGDGQPSGREEAVRALESIIRHWERHGFGRWAVVDKSSGKFIGFGGLRSLFGTPEVVYHLAKAHWGKGYASEMARATLRFGFEERGFDRIVAITKPQNAASIHVMDKVGLRFEKHARYYDIDVVQYEIKREEFTPDEGQFNVLPDGEM